MNPNMPYEFSQYYNKNGHFITDHGDVYFGCIWDFDERSFIVQPSRRKELFSINHKDITIEKILSMAWEITDFSKIKYCSDATQLGNTDPDPNIQREGSHKWKKMFVFGAGASAFSVLKDDMTAFRNSLYCPPIANELFGSKFQHLIKKYKGVELSLASLRSFGNDVEAFFEEEWKDVLSAHNPAITSRHINITYYLRELFTNISSSTIDNFYDSSLYCLLVDKIQKYLSKNIDDRIAFVSFNYDTILDHYLSQFFNAPFNAMEDYMRFNDKRFALFKPHGSCNWGWRFSDNFLNQNITDIPKHLYENQISFADIYFKHLGTPYEMIYHSSWGYELALSDHTIGKFTINKNKIEVVHDSHENTFPSLLIPYKDKDEMVMPYYHYNLLQWYINDMEELYLIGWKGNEASFNNLLKKHSHSLKRIIIVNPNPTEVELYLSMHINLKKYEIEYFHDFETFLQTNFS